MSRSIRGSTYQKNPLDFRGEKGAAIDALRHGASLRHHCIGNRKMSPTKASVFHTALLDRSADVPQIRSRGGEFPREEFISPIRGSNQEERPQGVITQKQDARIACLAFQPTALSLRLRWQQLFFAYAGPRTSPAQKSSPVLPVHPPLPRQRNGAKLSAEDTPGPMYEAAKKCTLPREPQQRAGKGACDKKLISGMSAKAIGCGKRNLKGLMSTAL